MSEYIFTGLSDQQAEIVCSEARKIIVDAGSGAGKTRTLIEKVKMLISSGADPKSIVVFTFTNMAADELKARLSDTAGADDAFIGTIHSYANKVLKKSGKEFNIFSEVYQTQFMEVLIPKYAKYCTLEDYKLFVKYDKLVTIGRMARSEVCEKFTDSKVYNEILYLLGRVPSYAYPETVVTLCEANNILTFDELIKLATDYFNEHNGRPKYLFVDELQDIGYLEYNFIMSINAEYTFCIGDDYQSIFGFKGGDVNIFLSLMHDPEWSTFYLTENYRTAKSILTYANSVIKQCHDIIRKDVVFKNTDNGKLEFSSGNLLSKFISEIPDGEDWFFITRTNKEMCYVESLVRKLGRKYYCFKQSAVSPKKLKEIRDTKCIKIMTAHASKGMECDNVAIYGRFPIKGARDEDEYKVFYVAITRAKNRCTIFV